MILKRHVPNGANEDANCFVVLDNDTLTKQQYADRESFNRVLLPSMVSLVAQLEMENMAGYVVEDDRGRLHTINYRQYTALDIDKLFLPPIKLPNPTMTLKEALVVCAQFAHEYVDKNMDKSDAFELPTNFVIAREVLGGRDAGMKVFEALVNVVKARK